MRTEARSTSPSRRSTSPSRRGPRNPRAKDPLARLVTQIAQNTTGAIVNVDDVLEDKGDSGKEDDFYKLMKKRAADYFNADKDGDSQLDFEEFIEMIAARDDATPRHDSGAPSIHPSIHPSASQPASSQPRQNNVNYMYSCIGFYYCMTYM